MPDPAAAFPRLFARQHIGYANADIRLTLDPVPGATVNRLHLVATTPDGLVVVCRSDRGWRFLPGGTREPAEPLLELARRELREEAGATLLGEPTIFAAFRVRSRDAEPYRPHLAHPEAAWAYAIVSVHLDAVPLNPPDGETVVEVLALPPAEAVAWLAEHDQIHADVTALAAWLGLIGPGRPDLS